MILPVYLYGHTALRQKSEDITKDYPDIEQLISDMFETMYKAEGVGLAAPQIGKNINIFVVDSAILVEEKNKEDKENLKNFKKTFINPKITFNSDKKLHVEEGCLSVPSIHEKVLRYADITVEYLNENFETVVENFKNTKARIIQHEYDHLQGTIFVDKISPIRKRFIKNNLNTIIKGKSKTSYKTKV